jgi:hypothetical protein
METWRHRDMETGRHGDGDIEIWRWNMETWKHGNMETWRHKNMVTKTWKHGEETWRLKDMDIETSNRNGKWKHRRFFLIHHRLLIVQTEVCRLPVC